MASWLKCTARRGGGAIHVNLENAVSIYWSERDKGTVIAFIGGEKDAVLVEERPRCCCIDRYALAPPSLRTIAQQVEVLRMGFVR